jgi:sarcosine oxidase
MDADVAVVGLGAAGSMALWRLSVRGLSVLGIDQFRPGHPFGSSHGLTRVFRLAAREGPAYVPLGQLSRRLWLELGETCGVEILTTTGGIMIGPPDSLVVQGTIDSAKAHDLAHEILTAGQLRHRYPQHVVTAGDIAVVDPHAGVLRPETAIKQAVRLATGTGARVLTDVRVTAIEPAANHVRLVTAGRTYQVGHLVLAAGAWTGKLLPVVAAGSRLRRLVTTWFQPRRSADPDFRPGAFPIFVRAVRDNGAWGHGAVDGPLVKVGTLGYAPGEPDPDDLDRAIYATDLDEVSRYVADYLPGLDPRPVKMQPCMIALSADEDFLLGPHPELPNITLLAGLGGHGFKYAAGLGEIAASLATTGQSPVQVDGFQPQRRSGQPSTV